MKVLEKYSTHVVPPSNPKELDRRIVRFKKPDRVTQAYKHPHSEPIRGRINKKNPIFKTNEYDIGVYSRSANKIFHIESD